MTPARPIANRATISAHFQAPWRHDRNGNLVAPVVMMKPGTLCGSGGCIHYPERVLRDSVPQWDNVPLVISHPVDHEGLPISVNAVPDQIIGHVRRPAFRDGALRAEIVINDPDQRGRVQGVAEVSTGAFVDEDLDRRATRIRPDHLALLPDERGACDWSMGCGVRANESGLYQLVAQSLRGHANAMGVNIMSDRRYEHEDVLYPPDVQANEREALTEAEIDQFEDRNDLLVPVEVRANAREADRRRAAQRGDDERARDRGNGDDDEAEKVLLPTDCQK